MVIKAGERGKQGVYDSRCGGCSTNICVSSCNIQFLWLNMELLKIVHKKAQNGLAYSQLNIEQVYMCAHTQKQPHTGCVIINAHHTWRVRKVECCYWTLNTFPPRSVCPSMRTEWNAPLLILSGCHSDENMGWEFGFEFSCCRNPMGQKHREGGRGRSRGNVCANDFEKLHVGLEGEKKEKRFDWSG